MFLKNNKSSLIVIVLIFTGLLYSINPPKNGGSIPQKYLDIFEDQKIIGNKSRNPLDNNVLSRSNFTEPQSPPSNYNLPVILVDFSSDKSTTISKEEFQGNGYWHSINMNGADEGYDGPDGFYEWDTITPLCDGEFDFYNETSYLVVKCGNVEYILYLK